MKLINIHIIIQFWERIEIYLLSKYVMFSLTAAFVPSNRTLECTSVLRLCVLGTVSPRLPHLHLLSCSSNFSL